MPQETEHAPEEEGGAVPRLHMMEEEAGLRLQQQPGAALQVGSRGRQWRAQALP